jgi:hypothetical protein
MKIGNHVNARFRSVKLKVFGYLWENGQNAEVDRSARLRLGILPRVWLVVAPIVGGVSVRAASTVTYYRGNFGTSHSTIAAGSSNNIVLSARFSQTFDPPHP